MNRKLTRLVILLGVLFYGTTLALLFKWCSDFKCSFLMAILIWLFSIMIGFILSTQKFLKVNWFSDIKEDFVSPTYKLEKDSWGDWIVSKYIVVHSEWNNGWVLAFPLILLFKFRQYEQESYISVKTDADLKEMLNGLASLEEYYIVENEKYNKKIQEELSEQEKEEIKLKEVNKEYYGNYK